MKPRVGDGVHYRSRGSADGVFPPECRAAIITKIRRDSVAEEAMRKIDIAVLNPSGLFFDQEIEYDADLKPGTWHEKDHDDPPEDPRQPAHT